MCFSCIFLREVERFFYSLESAQYFCSFSSAAHLVGYYVKEMESIAEQWVTLFTGKSDDQRQGITPSWSDVSWKIPLFHWEEGKVQRTLEMVGMTTGTFVRKGRRTEDFGHTRDNGIRRNVKNAEKKCQMWKPLVCEIKIWSARCFITNIFQLKEENWKYHLKLGAVFEPHDLSVKIRF